MSIKSAGNSLPRKVLIHEVVQSSRCDVPKFVKKEEPTRKRADTVWSTVYLGFEES